MSKRSLAALLILAWLTFSATSGWFIANFYPLTDNAVRQTIEMDSAISGTIAERGSKFASQDIKIDYLTTGPILKEYYLSDGYCVIVPCVISNKIIVESDGSAGEVELHIPASLSDRFRSSGFLSPNGWIGNVRAESGNLPFERVTINDQHTVIRFRVSANEYQVTIIETISPGSQKVIRGFAAAIFTGLALCYPVILMLRKYGEGPQYAELSNYNPMKDKRSIWIRIVALFRYEIKPKRK